MRPLCPFPSILCTFLQHAGEEHEAGPDATSSGQIAANKVGALFVFFVVPFIGCIVAWFFSINPELLKYGLLFASGLFLALALEHLVGDAVAGFAELTPSRTSIPTSPEVTCDWRLETPVMCFGFIHSCTKSNAPRRIWSCCANLKKNNRCNAKHPQYSRLSVEYIFEDSHKFQILLPSHEPGCLKRSFFSNVASLTCELLLHSKQESTS